jgi:hypothetical protein
MNDEIIRSQYRFPKKLIEWVKGKAKDNSRSMNGELVEIVKQAKEKEEVQKSL